MKNKHEERQTIKAVTYTYEALVDSKRYQKHNWAARAALDKNQRYTLEEADRIVFDYLNRRVV